jgi:WD40 repeat protein
MSLLAITVDSGRVHVWHPSDDTVLYEMEIHRGAITALCAVRIGERRLVASGGTDSTVRIWDPLTGEHVRTIPVHYPVGSLAFERGVLAIALPTGVLALEIDRAAANAAL